MNRKQLLGYLSSIINIEENIITCKKLLVALDKKKDEVANAQADYTKIEQKYFGGAEPVKPPMSHSIVNLLPVVAFMICLFISAIYYKMHRHDIEIFFDPHYVHKPVGPIVMLICIAVILTSSIVVMIFEKMRYKRKLEEYNKSFKHNSEIYTSISKDIKKLDDAVINYKTNYYSSIQLMNGTITKSLETSQVNLKKLYDMDVIYIRYRTYPLVCALYDYFASRSELKTFDEAYDWIDAEIRVGRICESLSDIDRTLNKNYEAIRRNQLSLLQSINRTKSEVDNLSKDMARICNMVAKGDIQLSEVALTNPISTHLKNINRNELDKIERIVVD